MLPIRVRKKFDESYRGFVVRLLQKNYFTTFSSIANSCLEIKMKYLSIKNESDITSIKIDTNINQVNKVTHDSFYLLNHNNSEITQMPLRALSTDGTKICPKCLNEQKYLRMIWDIKVYLACAKHKLLLLSRCPACNKKIYPFHIPIGFCSCGFDLSKSPEIPSSDICSDFSKLLEEKCFEEKDLAITNSFGPLIQLSLIEIIVLCKRFSVIIGNNIFGTWTSYNKIEDRNMIEILDYTFNIFNSWPKNYHLFLDHLADIKRSKNQPIGYSSLFHAINNRFNEKSLEFIHTELEKYLIKNWDKGYFKRPKGSNFSELFNYFIGIEEASRKMNVFPKKLLNLVEAGVLEGTIIQGNKKKTVLIKKDSLHSYKLYLEQIVTFGNAQKLLGLSYLNMHQILKSNLLNAKKVNSTGVGNWNILMRDVFNILDVFEDSCVEITCDEVVLGFTEAVQLVAQWGYDVTLIITLVQESKLVPRIIKKGEGLHQYYFIKQEIEGAVNEYRSDKVLFQKDVAKILGIAPIAVVSWVKLGILTCDIPYGKRGVGVHPNTFQKFNEKYITLREILKFLPSHTFNTIVDYLMKLSITPITGTRIDGNVGYLFLRADILELINQASEDIKRHH